jgi:AcrR family transcriptional regulator
VTTVTHRERMLEGLAQSIREKGLADTQITDIVRHARASRRTFYQHFPDKESCFVELGEALTAQVMEQVTAAIDRSAPWPEQVDRAIDAYLALLATDPALTLTFASRTLGPRVVSVQRDGIERYAELLVELAGSAGIDPVSLDKAVMLIGGLHEMIVRAVERGESVEGLGPIAKDVIKRALAP